MKPPAPEQFAVAVTVGAGTRRAVGSISPCYVQLAACNNANFEQLIPGANGLVRHHHLRRLGGGYLSHALGAVGRQQGRERTQRTNALPRAERSAHTTPSIRCFLGFRLVSVRVRSLRCCVRVSILGAWTHASSMENKPHTSVRRVLQRVCRRCVRR